VQKYHVLLLSEALTGFLEKKTHGDDAFIAVSSEVLPRD
jgi:hypothetical protein